MLIMTIYSGLTEHSGSHVCNLLIHPRHRRGDSVARFAVSDGQVLE
jgi:hypothetical protein